MWPVKCKVDILFQKALRGPVSSGKEAFAESGFIVELPRKIQKVFMAV